MNRDVRAVLKAVETQLAETAGPYPSVLTSRRQWEALVKHLRSETPGGAVRASGSLLPRPGKLKGNYMTGDGS